MDMTLTSEGDPRSFGSGSEKGLVSIIIPTYNRGYIIADALNSVLNQSYRNIEVIVVDDASSDGTEELVKSFGDGRISYIRHDANRGEAGATNTGILRSRGEFITFLDSDDEIFPEKISRQVGIMEDEPGLGACFTSVLEPGDNGVDRVWVPFNPPESFCNVSGMYRRKTFMRAWLLDEKLELCSDVEISVRLYRECEVKTVEDVLMRRKRSPDSKSLRPGSRDAKYRSYVTIYRRHGGFLTRKFGRKFISGEMRGWGKYLLEQGKWSEARKCLIKAMSVCPWDLTLYGKFLFSFRFFRMLR